MSDNQMVQVIFFGRCPICKEKLRAGTLRCQQGHPLHWSKEKDIFIASIRKDPISWPQSGRIHFRNEEKVITREKPDGKSKKVHGLLVSQKVVVVEEKDGYYRLQSGGWVEHGHVVLSIRLSDPPRKAPVLNLEAVVIRNGGATVWGDAKFTKRIRLLPKGTHVKIYEIKGNAARVHADRSEWMNVIAIDRIEGSKKKKK